MGEAAKKWYDDALAEGYLEKAPEMENKFQSLVRERKSVMKKSRIVLAEPFVPSPVSTPDEEAKGQDDWADITVSEYSLAGGKKVRDSMSKQTLNSENKKSS